MSPAKYYPQRVDAPLTLSAIFLVLTISDGDEAAARVRSTISRISGMIKNVAIRDLTGANIACTIGIGSEAWRRLLPGVARPAELHAFQEVRGATHTAVSTPGDLLLHLRADRHDMCYELERQILEKLGDAVQLADETVGFRYFDARDLLGFVDGTANPVGPAVPQAVLVAAEDHHGAETIAGGSYVVVQKYLHDMASWQRLSTEKQEAIIGRTKMDNTQLPDAAPGQQASHKTLTSVKGEDILRDNMPFGQPGRGEFGTYFIGYARRLWVVEKMMQRMFVGEPEGKHDRILDFSTAKTGTVFFAPSASLLAKMDSL